ncbi:phosphate/phosphite/phosphonate ABC transporter substrate-binding protein [Myxococcota bacterium]
MVPAGKLCLMRVWGGIFFVAVLAVACTDKGSGKASPDDPVVTIREGGTERPAELVFSVTPYLPEAELRARYLPLAEYVGKKVGVPVRWKTVESYDGMVRALAQYEVHIAVLSPFNYVTAKRENPSIILLAVPVAGGATTYSGYIFTREDSTVESIADLKGKHFGFVDRQSASGYLYPLVYLRAQGYEPEHFGKVSFVGNHTRLVDMLLAGEIDAGASYAIAISRPDGKQLRILAKTGRIPLDPWCASPRLDQGLVDAIREALVGLNTRTKEGRRILTETETNGFRFLGDDHYDDVRRVFRLVGGEGANK